MITGSSVIRRLRLPSNGMHSEPVGSGFVHYPDRAPTHGLALTHGAGSNCNAPLLLAVAQAFAEAGVLVYRYDLPFRRKRASGPPFPAMAAADRDGVREAVRQVRALVSGRVLAGGHSYGARQTTMAAAEDERLADGLLLLSYPLHPPDKPTQLRTGHFPGLRTRALFVHGGKDPFGSLEEMREALKEVPGDSELFCVEKAGHDLGRKPEQLAGQIVERASRFLVS